MYLSQRTMAIEKSFIDLLHKPFWIMLNWNGKGHCITNLPGFIGSYKLCVKFDFHRFVQKSYEFHAIVNINNIFTYSIS
jgi:hypothetical protein